ncbi:MAG: ATPase involved in chromosome partitioning [Acidimicrobiaceae bacterium]|nr:ATPase involved in chromosome partitioning [Acidimicrobiaceae bacterium]
MTHDETLPAATPEVTADAVLDALRDVVDPELHESLVELGMIRNVEVTGAVVAVDVALTIASCPLRGQIREDVASRVGRLAGVADVEVRIGVMGAEERSALMARARRAAQQRAVAVDLPPSARVLGVVSGKGGVGKSSISVNLAVALASRGLTVGLLDADIWGFSIPRMLGVDGPLEVRGMKMQPIERKFGAGAVKVVSMGFLSGEDDAIMWRGLMLNRALQHFLEDVEWGRVDYLVVDMPPGTGDVQMGLARMLPRTELLVVTTPGLAAQKVAGRAADMARKGHLRIAGVIENMSGFTCGHGERYELFGSGGGQRLAEEIGAPLVGRVPLDPSVAVGGDTGAPAALDTASPIAAVFADLAERVATEIAPLVDLEGCSARLLANVEAALDRSAS